MSETPTSPVLLVEDDRLLRGAFRILLEDAGYCVLEAGSAAEALACVVADRPAVVVLDLGLPDRPGLDVARHLRAEPETRQIPIIALTGHAGTAERRACLDAGCTYYFAKPMAPRTLLNQLATLLT